MKMRLFIIMTLCTLLFIKCTREEFESVPSTSDPLASLSGSWKIKSVIQKDETAEIKNSPYVTMNLTSLFPYTQYQLALTGTAGSLNGTFTANPGDAPKIISYNTGTWEVDDVKNPKKITFINGANRTEMQIGSYPTPSKLAFKLKQTKIDAATNKPAITYEYEFVKQ